MKSLIGVKINWLLYFGILLGIRVAFPAMEWTSIAAIAISLHQFFLLFKSIGYFLPIRYLTGSLACLQLLIGPTLAYNGLDKYQFIKYTMQVPESDYFFFAIPAVTMFIVGLHFFSQKLEGEMLNKNAITVYLSHNQIVPIIFIIVGIASDITRRLLPDSLAFVFYLFGALKFVGALMLIFSNSRRRFFWIALTAASLIISSLRTGMFYDLIIWSIIFGAIAALRYKPSTRNKYILATIFLVSVAGIQLIKKDFRAAISGPEEISEIEALQEAVEKTTLEKSKNIWIYLASQNVRINQGFIVAYILKNVPAQKPFSNGSTLADAISAALLPRFIAPNKLSSGNREHFIKYTGFGLSRRTSMSLGTIGECYVNFGQWGGTLLMLFIGIIFNSILNALHRFYGIFPALFFFVPFVFFYPIRPDTDLQTIFGHLIKSLVVVFSIFALWIKIFAFNPTENVE